MLAGARRPVDLSQVAGARLAFCPAATLRQRFAAPRTRVSRAATSRASSAMKLLPEARTTRLFTWNRAELLGTDTEGCRAKLSEVGMARQPQLPA